MSPRRTARTDPPDGFKLLFANNPLPMWVYDLETLLFLEVNDAAMVQYGYSRDEFLRMRITDIRPKEDVSRLLEHVAMRRPRLQSSGEWRHQRKDGHIIDVQITSHALTYDGRKAALVVAQDITERKRAEEALRESAERFRLVARAASDAVWDWDLLANQVWRGDGYQTMFGYPGDAIQPSLEWGTEKMHPDDRERVTSGFRAVIASDGRFWSDEYRFRRADGSFAYVLDRGYVLRDAGGRPLRMIGAMIDMTERKRAEEAVWKAREADRANQAKSEFLSRMSHELRTPLNAILGFGQLLEMQSLSVKQREYVEDILKGGRLLLDLINEVLEIARIEAGRLSISPEPVSVQEVVQESLALMAPISAREGVRLEDGTAGVPDRFVWADRQRLKQVLLNLLSNAVKYNRKGGLVALAYEVILGDRLRIKVSDTGPGIAPERLERLFIPFERLGAEQTAIEGTGLGLALSKRLVEVMGGTLGVDSIVDRGSTFWVELALAEGPVAEEGTVLPASSDITASRSAGTVLYIEDNLSNLKLIQGLLSLRSEIRLIPAMQGGLGLDLARQHRPDVIFLDLHLPDMPGEELLLRLRATPETRGIPVVVISADATAGRIDRLLASGAQAYLTKPLEAKKFLAILDEILQERGLSHAGENS
ncbi:MAG TPA: PAS domain S-box protein [bacterium]|nr:PAS domain S-box protein [bacterium]